MLKKQKIRIFSLCLVVIGLIDALYLSYSKIFHTELYCAGSNNCATVNASRYATIAGIPNAFIGVGAYIVILAILILENKHRLIKDNSPILIFGLSLIGSLYSIFLTYVEIALLKAVCPYCFVSAVVMWLLLILAIINVFRQANS